MDVDIYEDLDFNLGHHIDELRKENERLTGKTESLEKSVGDLQLKLKEVKELNEVLKTNISNLYKTAIEEVERKSRTITEIRQELDNFMVEGPKNKDNSEYNALVTHFKQKCEQLNEKDKIIGSLKLQLDEERKKAEKCRKTNDSKPSGSKRSHHDEESDDEGLYKRKKYCRSNSNERKDEHEKYGISHRFKNEFNKDRYPNRPDFRKYEYGARFRNRRYPGRSHISPRSRVHFNRRYPNDSYDFLDRKRDHYDQKDYKYEELNEDLKQRQSKYNNEPLPSRSSDETSYDLKRKFPENSELSYQQYCRSVESLEKITRNDSKTGNVFENKIVTNQDEVSDNKLRKYIELSNKKEKSVTKLEKKQTESRTYDRAVKGSYNNESRNNIESEHLTDLRTKKENDSSPTCNTVTKKKEPSSKIKSVKKLMDNVLNSSESFHARHIEHADLKNSTEIVTDKKMTCETVKKESDKLLIDEVNNTICNSEIENPTHIESTDMKNSRQTMETKILNCEKTTQMKVNKNDAVIGNSEIIIKRIPETLEKPAVTEGDINYAQESKEHTHKKPKSLKERKLNTISEIVEEPGAIESDVSCNPEKFTLQTESTHRKPENLKESKLNTVFEVVENPPATEEDVKYNPEKSTVHKEPTHKKPKSLKERTLSYEMERIKTEQNKNDSVVKESKSKNSEVSTKFDEVVNNEIEQKIAVNSVELHSTKSNEEKVKDKVVISDKKIYETTVQSVGMSTNIQNINSTINNLEINVKEKYPFSASQLELNKIPEITVKSNLNIAAEIDEDIRKLLNETEHNTYSVDFELSKKKVNENASLPEIEICSFQLRRTVTETTAKNVDRPTNLEKTITNARNETVTETTAKNVDRPTNFEKTDTNARNDSERKSKKTCTELDENISKNFKKKKEERKSVKIQSDNTVSEVDVAVQSILEVMVNETDPTDLKLSNKKMNENTIPEAETNRLQLSNSEAIAEKVDISTNLDKMGTDTNNCRSNCKSGKLKKSCNKLDVEVSNNAKRKRKEKQDKQSTVKVQSDNSTSELFEAVNSILKEMGNSTESGEISKKKVAENTSAPEMEGSRIKGSEGDEKLTERTSKNINISSNIDKMTTDVKDDCKSNCNKKMKKNHTELETKISTNVKKKREEKQSSAKLHSDKMVSPEVGETAKTIVVVKGNTNSFDLELSNSKVDEITCATGQEINRTELNNRDKVDTNTKNDSEVNCNIKKAKSRTEVTDKKISKNEKWKSEGKQCELIKHERKAESTEQKVPVARRESKKQVLQDKSSKEIEKSSNFEIERRNNEISTGDKLEIKINDLFEFDMKITSKNRNKQNEHRESSAPKINKKKGCELQTMQTITRKDINPIISREKEHIIDLTTLQSKEFCSDALTEKERDCPSSEIELCKESTVNVTTKIMKKTILNCERDKTQLNENIIVREKTKSIKKKSKKLKEDLFNEETENLSTSIYEVINDDNDIQDLERERKKILLRIKKLQDKETHKTEFKIDNFTEATKQNQQPRNKVKILDIEHIDKSHRIDINKIFTESQSPGKSDLDKQTNIEDKVSEASSKGKSNEINKKKEEIYENKRLDTNISNTDNIIEIENTVTERNVEQFTEGQEISKMENLQSCHNDVNKDLQRMNDLIEEKEIIQKEESKKCSTNVASENNSEISKTVQSILQNTPPSSLSDSVSTHDSDNASFTIESSKPTVSPPKSRLPRRRCVISIR